MKTSSAKAKGRKLQQWVVEKLVAILAFDPEDLESRPMGSSGEDVIMGVQSRKQFPYSIPLVIIKRNNSKPLALVDAEYFIALHGKKDEQ